MNSPKFTINVKVDNPELVEEMPNETTECDGYVLIAFNGEHSSTEIIHTSINKIAMAMSTCNQMEQAMAIAEGYIKAMAIEREANKYDFIGQLLKGVEH
jgi:hypothetical protein